LVNSNKCVDWLLKWSLCDIKFWKSADYIAINMHMHNKSANAHCIYLFYNKYF